MMHYIITGAKPILNHGQSLSWVTHPVYALSMGFCGVEHPSSGHAPSQLFLHFLYGRAWATENSLA